MGPCKHLSAHYTHAFAIDSFPIECLDLPLHNGGSVQHGDPAHLSHLQLRPREAGFHYARLGHS